MDKIQKLHRDGIITEPNTDWDITHATITEDLMGRFKHFCDLHRYTADYTGKVVCFKKESEISDKRYTMSELIQLFKETL